MGWNRLAWVVSHQSTRMLPLRHCRWLGIRRPTEQSPHCSALTCSSKLSISFRLTNCHPFTDPKPPTDSEQAENDHFISLIPQCTLQDNRTVRNEWGLNIIYWDESLEVRAQLVQVLVNIFTKLHQCKSFDFIYSFTTFIEHWLCAMLSVTVNCHP